MEFSQEKLIYQYSNTCKSTENPEQYGLQKAKVLLRTQSFITHFC